MKANIRVSGIVFKDRLKPNSAHRRLLSLADD